MSNFDVFVNYTKKDDQTGWVTALVEHIVQGCEQLIGADLNVFFDRESIERAEQWKEKIQSGLSGCPVLLVFVSPNYFRSEYCLKEWNEYKKACRDQGIPPAILPIYIEDDPTFSELRTGDPNPWKLELKDIQHADLRIWSTPKCAALGASPLENEFKKISQTLNKLVSDRPGFTHPTATIETEIKTAGRPAEKPRLPENVTPGEFEKNTLTFNDLKSAANELLSRIYNGRDWLPDLIIGVNQGGMATASLMSQRLDKPAGVIFTKRRYVVASGKRERVISHASLPQKVSGNLEFQDFQPETVLIVDAKFKSGESLGIILEMLSQHYPGADIRFGLVLTYGDWSTHWEVAFDDGRWPVKSKTRLPGIFAYVAYYTDADMNDDNISEELRPGSDRKIKDE